jgi:hypothetical protein
MGLDRQLIEHRIYFVIQQGGVLALRRPPSRGAAPALAVPKALQ